MVLTVIILGCWPLLAIDDANRKQLDQLLQDGRFLSAWQLADKMDPDSSDPDLLIKKANCLLHGLVLPADTNQYFLKDGPITGLDSGKPLSVEGLSAIHFPLVDTLSLSLKSWPASLPLQSLLGSANWLLFRASLSNAANATLFAQASQEAYLKAIKLGANDPVLYWRLGILLLRNDDTEAALAFLGKALPALEKNADFRYDLSFLLWQKGNYIPALEHARFAVEKQKNPEMQTLARLLVADIQFSQKDTVAALAGYKAIYDQDNTNLYPLRRMIECSLVLDDAASIEKFTKLYAESLPTNPDSLYRLTMLFIQYQKQDILFAVTRTLKDRFQKTEPALSGLMAIYEAMVLIGTNRQNEALAVLDEASTYLGSLYGPDHPISLKIQELYDSVRR